MIATLPWLLAIASALSPEVEGGITNAVEAELRETAAPGAAVAVVREGEVVYLRAFGVRSVDEPQPRRDVSHEDSRSHRKRTYRPALPPTWRVGADLAEGSCKRKKPRPRWGAAMD